MKWCKNEEVGFGKKKIVCVGVSYEIMLALGGLKEGEMV